MISFKDRFEAMVERIPGVDCHIWIGALDKAGYGVTTVSGCWRLAHRAAYELYVGPIPDGGVICHRCDNKWCVNPDHLWAGSHKDNSEDMVRKGRQCKGENFWSAKLTPDDVRAIRRSTDSQRKIARTFGVSQSMVGFIKRRQSWKHVDDL